MAQIRTRTGDDARTVILRTATSLLREEGMEGVTVSRVAAEVGVTKAAVHYHFGGRENLRRAVYAPILAELETLLRDSGGRSATVAAFIDLIARNKEIVEICARHAASEDGSEDGIDVELQDVRERLIEGLAPVEQDSVLARLRVTMFFGACAAVVSAPSFGPDRLPEVAPTLRRILDA